MAVSCEIDNKAIDEILHSILGKDEDAYQDAWLVILEKQIRGQDEVENIAKEIKRKYSNQAILESHKLQSLSEPLGNTENFTLENILQAKPIEQLDYPTRFAQPANPHMVGLDKDTRGVLKRKFPNLSYRDAIRQLVGLPAAVKKNYLWQLWEDEVVKRVYPWGGTLAVSLELTNRTQLAVRDRAVALGVKFDVLRPNAEWLTTAEVARILGTHTGRVRALAKCGKLESIRLKYEGVWLYYRPEVLEKFIENQPWEYHAEKVAKHYQQYIPGSRRQWVTMEEAAQKAGCFIGTIERYRKVGLIPSQIASPYQILVRLEDVKNAQQGCQETLRTANKGKGKPYKTAINNGLTHYIYQDEDGDWYLRCKPHTSCKPFHLSFKKIRRLGLKLYPKLQFTRGKPTCKVCLSMKCTKPIMVEGIPDKEYVSLVLA